MCLTYVQCADCNQSLHVQGTEAHLQATECSGTVTCSRRGVPAAEDTVNISIVCRFS